MTYKEWADDYLRQADIIKGKLITLRDQLCTAPCTELKELNHRIGLLYKMYLDCMHTAEILNRRKGEV